MIETAKFVQRLLNGLRLVETFKKPSIRRKKEPKKKEKGKENHQISWAKSGGNVTRDANHPRWGYRYLMGKSLKMSVGFDVGSNVDERRKIYNEFDFVDTFYRKEFADKIKEKYHFPYKANFCKQAYRKQKDPRRKGKKQYAGQRFPYVWQSHHLIPDEIFNGEQPVFTDIQRSRIMAAGYNINHGHNIIFLPAFLEEVFVHGLCQHLGSHPRYTTHVEAKVKALRNEIPKEEDDEKAHKIIEAVVKDLRSEEHDIWKDLVKDCRAIIRNEARLGDYVESREEKNFESYKLV